MIWLLFWMTTVSLLFMFAFVILFGAPFLPTLRDHVPKALDLIDLQPGQTLLELGSGDGRVLIAAAERGLIVIGYELNPVLVIYSWLRTRKYDHQVKVVWGNYWRKELPTTDGIFVFLLRPYMHKLDKKIIHDCHKSVKLVSFAFEIPNRKPTKKSNGLFLYDYV